MSDGIDRRTFVKGATLGLAAPGLLAALAGCGPSPDLGSRLTGFYGDATAADAVGRAYLQVTPEEQDRDQLVEALAGGELEAWEELLRRDPAALEAAVRARHLDDFATGRTVRLHGWILSRTEARLAALPLL